MQINFTTNVRPGSAWATWAEAGKQAAQAGLDVAKAADAYSLQVSEAFSGSKNARDIARRAFLEGAISR